ncbi:MAG TPA: hypothetical protein VHD56_05650 [Tepidisphaeraceae bacterium]|nr:hypothetical protein [Tepidisphaeraceae bacterium]
MGSSEEAPPAVSPQLARWATPLLLIVGAQVWLLAGNGDFGSTRQRVLLLAAFIISCIPPLASRLNEALDRLRHLTIRQRACMTMVLAVLSAGYFYQSAIVQNRSFTFKFNDESSYAIGTQMAARFHLWMPQHPAGDFFEAMQLIVHPVYSSMYFPGTAILYAPIIWLHLPWWLLPLLAASACAGLTYRITSELLDSVAGLTCVLLLWGSSIFRFVSIAFLAQIPALLLALLAIDAWLRWRTNRRLCWAIAVGFFSGWCAITRPLDAVALLLPPAIAMLMDAKRNWRPLGSVAAGALPFLVIQIIFNIGVTGSWHRTPFEFSQAQDYPQVSLGFHPFDPTVKPATSLPQKLDYYEQVTVPALRAHQFRGALSWLPDLMQVALPQPLLLLIIPAGLLAWGRRRWIVTISAILWVLLYSLYVFHFRHYIATIVPMLAVGVACGIEQLRNTWPGARNTITVFLTLAVIVLSMTHMPQFNPLIRDEWFSDNELQQIDHKLAEINQPALVLFRYDDSRSGQIEPVYNSDVAWPDDAKIVRANDRAEQNEQIISYYLQRQPARAVYRYDRKDGSLTRLSPTTTP